MPKTVLLNDDQVVVAKGEIAGLREIGTKFAKASVELEEVKTKLKTAPAATAEGVPTPGKVWAKARDLKREKQGPWNGLGHQLEVIRRAKTGQITDEEKKWLTVDTPQAMIKYYMEKGYTLEKATGASEAVGPDGGFLLQPTYAEGVMELVHDFDNLIDRCDKYEMASPSMKFRAVDETSIATTRRGGVLGYWVDEGGTLTSSKPKFRQIEQIPHKVAVLTYGTEELLADAPTSEQFFSRYAMEELVFQTNLKIFSGTGAGCPLGIMNSACLITLSAEVGQATKTVVTENIVKMFARLHSGSRANAVWFANQDVTPQIHLATLGVGTGGVVTYMPPGGISEKPYKLLLGLPYIEIPWASTLGTAGDIVLADMKSYLACTRGSVLSSNSIHVAFLTDEVAFKWTFRVDGSPWWNQALTPFNGSNTQSPFIALASR